MTASMLNTSGTCSRMEMALNKLNKVSQLHRLNKEGGGVGRAYDGGHERAWTRKRSFLNIHAVRREG